MLCASKSTHISRTSIGLPLLTRCEFTVSGEAPTTPVASSKSGTVFEKRLIEAYIAEHGKDPVTGEELSSADLIELKCTSCFFPFNLFPAHNPTAARVVRPRPPTLTSIPSLLATFQNEWDALALETHTLRQHLSQTRQELSTALYQHDAATRVIARLLKERDEARDALSKISVGTAPAAGNSDAMEVDGQSVPSYIQDRVEETMKEFVTLSFPSFPSPSANTRQQEIWNKTQTRHPRRLGHPRNSLHLHRPLRIQTTLLWLHLYRR